MCMRWLPSTSRRRRIGAPRRTASRRRFGERELAKLFRIEHEGRARYAVESGGTYRLVDGRRRFEVLRSRAEAAAHSGAEVKPTKILTPVSPSKIVAIGLNYKDHAAEMNKPLPAEPLMFMKPSTAVIGPGDAIRFRRCRRDSSRGRARGRHRKAGVTRSGRRQRWSMCSA